MLAAAHTFAAGLQMISAPYDFTGLGDFATLFGLATPLANPNPRLIQWEPLAWQLCLLSRPRPPTRCGPARGTGSSSRRRLTCIAWASPSPRPSRYRIPLQAGWNQIGDPFLGSVPLSTVTADTAAGSGAVALTAATSPVQSNLFRYDPSTDAYVVG